MKFSPLVLCAILVLFATLACKKDADSEKYLRGTLDGQAFEANTNITANKPEAIPGVGSDPTLRITGDWPSFNLKLFLSGEQLNPGSYPFAMNLSRNARLQTSVMTWYAGFSGFAGFGQLTGSGSITISSISKNHVKGSFEFTAWDGQGLNSKTITNGSFSIPRE